jgi:hypothetical protein
MGNVSTCVRVDATHASLSVVDMETRAEWVTFQRVSEWMQHMHLCLWSTQMVACVLSIERTAQCSTVQHSAAQHSTAQCSTIAAQHSAATQTDQWKAQSSKAHHKTAKRSKLQQRKAWTAQHTADLHITCNTAEYIHAHHTVVSTLKRPCMHRECEEADLISRLSDGHGRDGNDSRYEVCLGRLVRLLVESSVGCGCFRLFRRC